MGLIDSGKFANNFFDGEVFKGSSSELEKVGGCLLDKASAIVMENGVEQFVNDLQVDLAACCMPDRDACVKDVDPAYSLLAAVASGEKKASDVAAEVAARCLAAARSRVTANNLKNPFKELMAKCPGEPEACTLYQLTGS